MNEAELNPAFTALDVNNSIYILNTTYNIVKKPGFSIFEWSSRCEKAPGGVVKRSAMP